VLCLKRATDRRIRAKTPLIMEQRQSVRWRSDSEVGMLGTFDGEVLHRLHDHFKLADIK
jgi:hypothetical protein